jgi:hypothetical protein
MLICTSICSNYLPKAMVLAESVKRLQPGRKFVVCLVEKEVPAEARRFPHFDDVILARDLGFPNFGRFIASHSKVEAATAVKGQLFRHLLDRFPGEQAFVYLDPDIRVFTDPTELDELLQHEDIVLTPHLLYPGNLDMELSCLNHGIYNLGFLAVRRSPEAERFIEWWSARLDFACYDDMGNGLFTDQKWVDLAPAFFNVRLLKHPGYNVATWTLMHRKFSESEGMLKVNGQPVRFIHFSGFDSGTYFKAIDWWVTEHKELAVRLGEEYRAALSAHGQDRLGRIPWSYDLLDNGRPFPPDVRRALRDKNLLPEQDPYSLTAPHLKKLAAKRPAHPFLPLTLIKKIIRKTTAWMR